MQHAPAPAPCTLLEMVETCERWFTQHSPTADLIPVKGTFPGTKAIHPMLEMLRQGLAASPAARQPAPQFVIIVTDGLVSGVHSLNGQENAHYLLIDEDSIEDEQEDEGDGDPGYTTDEIIRRRLRDDPNNFLQVMDGATNDVLTLYPETSKSIRR